MSAVLFTGELRNSWLKNNSILIYNLWPLKITSVPSQQGRGAGGLFFQLFLLLKLLRLPLLLFLWYNFHCLIYYCLKSRAFSVLKGPQIQHFIPHQDKCVYPSCLVCATTVEGIFIFETQAQSHMKEPMALRKNVAPERFHHLKLQNDKFDGSLTDPQRIAELKLSEVRFHSRITCCTVSRPDHGDRIYYFHAKFMCTNRIWWRKGFQTMPGK